jgi:hypothetical protein
VNPNKAYFVNLVLVDTNDPASTISATPAAGASGDNTTEVTTPCRALTTNATIGDLCTFPITSNKSMFVVAKILAHCTGGSACTAGTANNSAGYLVVGTCKNNGGTTGAVTNSPTLLNGANGHEDADWTATIDCDDTTDSARVRITGAANTNITWFGMVTTMEGGL